MGKRGRKSVSSAEALGPDSFSLLTRDVVLKIMTFLSFRDKFVLCRISKQMISLLHNSKVWDELHRELFFATHRSSRDYSNYLQDVEEAFMMSSVSTREVQLFKDDVTMRCVAFGGSNLGYVGEKTKGLVHSFDVTSAGGGSQKKKNKGKLTPIVQTYVVQNGGKKTSVNSLKLNADFSRLFVGVSKPTVRVHCFDIESGQELCTYPQHVDSIFAIAVNSTCVMSGGGQTDKNLIISDLESQAKLMTHPHKGSVRGLDCTENLVLSGSLDGYVRLFDLRTGNCEKSRKFPSTCHGVSFLRQNLDRFVCTTGRSDNSVYMCMNDFEDTRLVSKHKNGVSSAYIDGFSCVSADYDGTLIKHSLYSKKSITSKTNSGEIHSLAAISPSSFFHANLSGALIHTFK